MSIKHLVFYLVIKSAIANSCCASCPTEMKVMWSGPNSSKTHYATVQNNVNDLKDAKKVSIFDEKLPVLCKDFASGLPLLGSLFLSNDDIEKIEPGAFNNLPNFQKLDLFYNKLESVDEGVFGGLNLVYLRLNNNNIKTIHPQAFRGLNRLRKLELKVNKLESIAGIFNDIPSLEELDVSTNKLGSLEGNIFGNNNLRVLSLKNISAATIGPEVLSNIPTLRELDLSVNLIAEINEEWFRNLRELAYFSLRGNKLTEIGNSAFKYLTDNVNLQLDLANNYIRHIGEDAFKGLKGLVELDLGENLIKSIDKSITGIRSLETLWMSGNLISDVQPLKDMENLKKVGFSYNRVGNISTGIFTGSKINEISLDNNGIWDIEESAFDDMTELEGLSLGNNGIKEINPNWFKNTPKLESLTLGHNLIEEIPEHAFKNINGSKTLTIFLNDNKIKRVHPKAFENIYEIYLLKLDENQVEQLDEDIFKNINYMYTLDMRRNKLSCLPNKLDNILKGEVNDLRNNPWDLGCADKIKKYSANSDAKIITQL